MTLIFTDVDGTLINAEHPAVPPAAVTAAHARHEIVMASSRAVPELQAMQRDWGWQGALVAEDGAVVVERDGAMRILGVPIAELRRLAAPVLQPLAVTSHPTDALRLASLLLPRAVATPAVVDACRDRGLDLTVGGRWATLTGGADKGRGAGVIAAGRHVTDWVAIGNDANDLPLLAAASQAFVIRNPAGHHPQLAAVPGAVLLREPGPAGWPEMLLRLEAGTP